LAKGAYMSSMFDARRTSRDIDAYVRRRDLTRALEICRSFGAKPRITGRKLTDYQRFRGQLALYENGINIDLHWWLNNQPLHAQGASLSLDSVMDRAVPGVWRGVPVLFPCAADALLINAMYSWYENWGQFLRMYDDQRRLMSIQDWDAAVERAREVGLARLLHHSLLATQSVTQSAVPSGVLSALHERRALPVLVSSTSTAESVVAISVWSRLGRAAVNLRVAPARYLLHVVEATRIYSLADRARVTRLSWALMFPRRGLRQQLYFRPLAVFFSVVLHPLTVALSLAVIVYTLLRVLVRHCRKRAANLGAVLVHHAR
jgi:hypothetical protein